MTQLTEESHVPSRAAYYWGPGGEGPGCHCRGCTEANSAYKKWRELLIETGRWAPLVPAGPVREHIRRLNRVGMRREQLAERSGISVGGIQKILIGQRGKLAQNVKSATAAALLAVEPEPAMGIRAASTGRLSFEDVELPASSLLASGSAEVYAECIQLGRIAWSALAVGTGQAVLDYVIPYVKERTAFGEPIGNRQSVAFAVSNIAIELDGMRLATYRAASRADPGAARRYAEFPLL